MNIVLKFGAQEALEALPPRSIALDGYVRGPAIDLAHERYSFDHHDHCIRHVTSATCMQVLDAILVGFDPKGYKIYVNDIDADTVLSVYLLRNPQLAHEEKVRELVEAVGKVDSHGPSYELPPTLAKLADDYLEHALAPERTQRRNGTYGQGEGSLRALLDLCLERTEKFLAGTLEPRAPKAPAPYKILFSQGDLAMIEGDREVMGRAYQEGGWKKMVSMLPAKNGTHAYTIAKRSEFVQFDVPRVLQALHAREPGWGGGSTVGGAPRNPDGSRSKLTAKEVWEIVVANG
jgi:hypothetical protein